MDREAFGGLGQPPAKPSDAISRRFSTQRRRDTAPELALRRALHSRGLRYRVDMAPLPGLRRKADIVFTRAKVAVFVDGCFWHRCPEHGNDPRTNSDWWRGKLDTNVARDRHTDTVLRKAGWTVLRVWEHDATDAAELVIRAIAASALAPVEPPDD